MNARPLAFSLLSLIIILLLLESCDSQLTETEPETEIKMTRAPITYVSNSAKTKVKTSQESKNAAPYYCLVSTLNPEDEIWAYHKQRFDITIPKARIQQARKAGKDKKWVTYQFADKSALARTNADTLGGGGLVRMARCRLPATAKIVHAVEQQLSNFDQSSWVQESNTDAKQKAAHAAPGPLQTGWEYGCTAVIDSWICNEPNVVDPYNDPGCTLVDTRCVEYGLVYVEEDEEPGGGGESDDGGPCEPCIDEPGGPQGFCESQPGGGDGIPQGCAVTHDYEIIDPCDQAEELETDSTFIAKMDSLVMNANSKDYETGYLLTGAPGSYLYDYQHGTVSDPFMNFNGITQAIDGYIHSHYNFWGGLFYIFRAGYTSYLSTLPSGQDK